MTVDNQDNTYSVNVRIMSDKPRVLKIYVNKALVRYLLNMYTTSDASEAITICQPWEEMLLK